MKNALRALSDFLLQLIAQIVGRKRRRRNTKEKMRNGARRNDDPRR